MASAAMSIRQQPKRRGKVRLVVIHGARELGAEQGAELLLQVGSRLRARVHRLEQRYAHVPERPALVQAMARVERAIVEAYWVLGRSTSNPVPRPASQHGVGYMLEREDKWGSAVASGGWLSQPPPDPPPSAMEISHMHEPLEWLSMLEPEQREVVSAGARSKNGEVERSVSWRRVRLMYPKFEHWAPSRLRRAYQEGLRVIAVEKASA